MAKTPPIGQKAKKKTNVKTKTYANKIKRKAKKPGTNMTDAVSTLKRKSKSRTLIKSNDDSVNIVNELCSDIWWQYSDKLAVHIRDGIHSSSFAGVDEESKRAAMLFTKQEALFNARNAKDKDAKWLSTMMRNGTMSDRVSASTLAVQQNPVFSIKILLSLVSMAMKNNQREAQLAITALKDLFINNLMPSDRKLVYFAQQPVSHPRVSAKVLKLMLRPCVLRCVALAPILRVCYSSTIYPAESNSMVL